MVAPTDMYQLTRDVEKTPDSAAYIGVEFKAGIPVKVIDDSTKAVLASDPVGIMTQLNKIA